MANIHSSPLSPEFDIAYIPPIYPKSKDDATFIELVYFSQGCYVIEELSVRYYDHYTSTACTTKTKQSIRLQ